MPRNGSGVYSKPAGTTAVPNTPIESSKFNAVIDDLVQDANAARPVTAGGTGSQTKEGARDALGITGALAEKYDKTGGSVTGDITINKAAPIFRMMYGGVRHWFFRVGDDGRMQLVDETGGAERAFFMPDGSFQTNGRLYAGSGAYLDIAGNAVGAVWSDWGAIDAKTAIGQRIESRGGAYRDSALAQVMSVIASQGVGAIGTVALARFNGTPSSNPLPQGSIVSGSDLSYTNADGTPGYGTLSGTWRSMGVISTGNDRTRTTNFVRVT